jgi:isoleucyl-tRNA synthetase
MYTVLVTLAKALAPVVPFLSERMYQNLVVSCQLSVVGGEAPGVDQPSTINHQSVPESVHLCAYPQPDASLLKPELNRRTALAERVVRMGHRLREEKNLRVRQPLAELRYACAAEQDAADIAAQAEVIADELNVKAFTRAANLDDLVSYTYKPNLKTLGPKHGKLLGAIRAELPGLGDKTLAPLRSGPPVTVTIGGVAVELSPEDVLVSTEQASEWACAGEAGVQIALRTALSPELVREGMARDFVRQVQQLRKDAGLEITDRIRVRYATDDAQAAPAIDEWRAFIMAETLADELERVAEAGGEMRKVTVGDAEAWVGIQRV